MEPTGRGDKMKIASNLSSGMRVGYVLFGVLLVALAAAAPFLQGILALGVGIVGAVVAIEGAVGF